MVIICTLSPEKCWMETSFCQLQLAAPEGAVNALVSKKGHMTVKHVCADIMEVFEITGFVDILDIQ